ncbi:MAG: hypothetical protein HY001_05390 [Candidatus Portnoybacteria bacterium]|nr:hypothetical protein [Candidatus Portnoybacteria bacterium]
MENTPETKNSFLSGKRGILLIALVALVVLFLAGAIFYRMSLTTIVDYPYMKAVEKIQPREKLIDEPPLPVSPQVVIPPAATNPVEKLPDANPLNKAPNPFEGAYQNPFE